MKVSDSHKIALRETLNKVNKLTKVLDTSLKNKKELIYSDRASLRAFVAGITCVTRFQMINKKK